MEEKKNCFLFSTPIKPKPIKIFKKQLEVEEEGSVYDQLSKVLDEDSSNDLENQPESNNLKHSYPNNRNTLSPKYIKAPELIEVKNTNDFKNSAEESEVKTIIDEIDTQDNPNNPNAEDSLSLCKLLCEILHKEETKAALIQKDFVNLKAKTSRDEKELVGLKEELSSISKKYHEAEANNTLLRHQLGSLEDVFSSYKMDINSMLTTLNSNTSTINYENGRLSRENLKLNNLLNTLEVELKQTVEFFTSNILSQDKLITYDKEFQKLYRLKERQSHIKLIYCFREGLELGLIALGDSLSLIDTLQGLQDCSIKKATNDNVLKFRALEKGYQTILKSMLDKIDEYGLKLADEHNRLESIYFSFKTTIKRLKNKNKRLKAKYKTKRKRNLSDSDIWDVFK